MKFYVLPISRSLCKSKLAQTYDIPDLMIQGMAGSVSDLGSWYLPALLGVKDVPPIFLDTRNPLQVSHHVLSSPSYNFPSFSYELHIKSTILFPPKKYLARLSELEVAFASHSSFFEISLCNTSTSREDC
jgi:hypothetical protein